MTHSGDEDKSREELLEELEALRLKNARIEAEKAAGQLYREAPIGLCYLDTELRYVQINDWLAAINGLPASEHLGRTVSDILPHAASSSERQFRHVIESGEPIDGTEPEVTVAGLSDSQYGALGKSAVILPNLDRESIVRPRGGGRCPWV